MSSQPFDWENVWQVGCGDGSRDYRDLFLRFGLLAVGASSDLGPYHPDSRTYSHRNAGDAKSKIRPLAKHVDIGHTVVLKKGKSIVSIGQVVGEYQYDARG